MVPDVPPIQFGSTFIVLDMVSADSNSLVAMSCMIASDIAVDGKSTDQGFWVNHWHICSHIGLNDGAGRKDMNLSGMYKVSDTAGTGPATAAVGIMLAGFTVPGADIC